MSIINNTLHQPNINNPSINNKIQVEKFSWSAVIAGVLVGLGSQLTFNLLGAGIGAITFNADPQGMAISAFIPVIWVLLSGIVAMFLGGWVTGHLTFQNCSLKNALHGFVTWGIATLITFFFTFTIAGAFMNNTLNIVKQSATLAGQGASSLVQSVPGVAEKVQNLLPDLNQAQNQIKKKAEEIFNQAKVKEALHSGNLEEAKKELKEIVTALLTAESSEEKDSAKDKALSFLTAKTGFDKDQAEKIADNWLNKYEELKEKVTQAANEQKEKIAKGTEKVVNTLGMAALITALAFITSLFAAMIGAVRGGK
ncbi:MAG: hypothetical protein K0R24_1063 [Gammaproteobacteria bacterium]|jgi:hypothetical protein|nr:hypothetical protein [Gammaproteobacteria bacterium]